MIADAKHKGDVVGMLRSEYISRINESLNQCSNESFENIVNINRILIGLTESQQEYILELSILLFCQTP